MKSQLEGFCTFQPNSGGDYLVPHALPRNELRLSASDGGGGLHSAPPWQLISRMKRISPHHR
jgi:hypothetical protein